MRYVTVCADGAREYVVEMAREVAANKGQDVDAVLSA